MTQLALVIDLNVCVGCHACATSCKEWNSGGSAGPLTDQNPYGKDPSGTFFNRVQTYEVGEFPATETLHFPKSCLHCEDPPCVPVCPTGASYKRAEDGIVLVDYDKCIGCKYCAWACPYGAREIDEQQHVMKKCTLCVDRVTDTSLPEAERKPDLALAAEGRLRPALQVLEHALARQHAQGQSHLAAARFTVADLCVASVAMWIRPSTALMSQFPITAAWLKNCLDRPAHQAARA